MQVVGADPAGSVYSGGTGRPYLVEGVGEDFWPETYDRDVADRVIEVSDADSFAFTRRLAREEALLVGGSSGMAAYAARQLAHELAGRRGPDRRRDRRAAPGQRPRLPDQGLQRRLAGAVRLPDRARCATRPRPSARCCAARTAGCPTSCTPTPTRPSPRRSRSCRSTPSRRCPSSGPSRRSWPPRSRARSPTGRSSTRCTPAPRGSPTGSRTTCRPPLPTIGSTEDARDAVALLENADAVLVQEDGKPVGVLTRQDLLAFLLALSDSSAVCRGELPVNPQTNRTRMRTRSSSEAAMTRGRGVVHHRSGADAARVAVHHVHDRLLPAPPTSGFCRNPACDGEEFETAELTRRGTVWSYTDAQYQPPAPYVAAHRPLPAVRAGRGRAGGGASPCSARSPTATASRTSRSAPRSSSWSSRWTDELLVWRWKPVTELGEEADQ